MSRFVIFLIALILLFTKSFSQDIKPAIRLSDSEQFETAENAFKTLITNYPKNGDIYFYYGENVLKNYFADTLSQDWKESLAKAEKIFQQGTTVEPTNPLCFVGLAKIALFRNDTLTAKNQFDKAILLLPTKKNKIQMPTEKQAMVYIKMADGYIQAENKNIPKALSLLEIAEKINPKVPELFIVRGDAYLEKNDGSNSILNYKKSESLDPKSPKAKIKIGYIYVRSRNLKAAIPFFEDAQKIDSTFAPVYRELGELYYKAGQYQNAKKNYKKFLDLSGANYSAKIRYASFLFLSKNYQEAIDEIVQIFKVDTSSNFLNRFIAYSYFETSQYDNALKYIKRFLANSKPEKIIASDFEYFGRSLAKLNQDSLAIIQLKTAYEKDTSKHDLLSDIASSYSKLKKHDLAANYYVLKINTGDGSYTDWYNLGKSYYSNQQWGKADTAFTKLIELKPEFIPSYLYRARTNSNLDPENLTGQAKPLFELLINKTLVVDNEQNALFGKTYKDVITALGKPKSETEITEGTTVTKYVSFDKSAVIITNGTVSCIYSFDKQTKYSKELVEAYGYLGYYFLKKKDYKNAKVYYTKVQELDPANQNAKIVLESKELKTIK